jgi:hypothetical protein
VGPRAGLDTAMAKRKNSHPPSGLEPPPPPDHLARSPTLYRLLSVSGYVRKWNSRQVARTNIKRVTRSCYDYIHAHVSNVT